MIAIVPVTAMPYAAASAIDSLNEKTSAMHATINAVFTSGMKICPSFVAEVCTTVTRGK